MSEPLRQRLPTPPAHSLRSRAHRASLLAEGDPFLTKYFQRIDLKVAASFTPEQRRALRQMFGDYNQRSHLIDFRHSLPLGARRFYLVLLFGQERRSMERLREEGVLSRSTSLVVYLLILALLPLPVLGLYYLLKSLAGLDLDLDLGIDGSLPAALEALRSQIDRLFGA